MYYAIGDIHGEISLLIKLHEDILAHIKDSDEVYNEIVFLGDYIDRGENSKEVLDYVMALEDTEDLKHIFIKGNHEDLFIKAIESPYSDGSLWVRNGGNTTLRDFDTSLKYADKSIFTPYVDWMNDKCVNYYVAGDYVFCHGGVDTRTDLEDTEEDIFWWKRTFYIGEYTNYVKLVVHGHTPQESGLPLYGQNELNLDTGAYHTKKLTCAVLPLEYEDSFAYWLNIEYLVT